MLDKTQQTIAAGSGRTASLCLALVAAIIIS